LGTKTIAVVTGFAVILSGLVAVRLGTTSDFTVHGRIAIEGLGPWSQGQFDNIDFDAEANAVVISSGVKGTYISRPFKTQFPFNEVIITWNCERTQGGYLTASVRASRDGEVWTGWYEIASWPGGRPDREVGLKRDKSGYINEDYLVLRRKQNHLQFRFDLESSPPGSLHLESAYLVYTDTRADYFTFKKYAPSEKPELPGVNLEVPYFSQQKLPESVSWKACSPTSLAMVLNYHGVKVSPLEVAEKCYDDHNDIYGNWPYNIAAAREYGLSAWADRHNSFGEIAEEIGQGFPVVLSIAFGKGELKGSPVNETDGHLIVARGFTPEGNVICNDPAFHNASDGVIVYDREELERDWIGHHGVAYHLRPL
jgi:hypothetical protein